MPREKKRTAEHHLAPAEVFAKLRTLSFLPPEHCRRIVALLREDHTGTRVCQRRCNAYAAAHKCLEMIELPREDGTGSVPVATMSLERLVQAKRTLVRHTEITWLRHSSNTRIN